MNIPEIQLLLDPLLLSETCIVRQRTENSIEVWGNDISKHFLVRYDEQQTHFLDVIYISQDHLRERTYGMG